MSQLVLYVLACLGVLSTVVVIILVRLVRNLHNLVDDLLYYLDTGEIRQRKKSPWWKFWG